MPKSKTKATTASLIFPHQLFENHPAISKEGEVFLIEEWLFFQQYRFHKQKLVYHRAGMKYFESRLKAMGCTVHYIDCTNNLSDIRNLLPQLAAEGFEKLYYCDVTDFWLEKRIESQAIKYHLKCTCFDSPGFINSKAELTSYFKTKKRFFQTDFYIDQRKSRKILLDNAGKPMGGKWSFDDANRLRYPKGKKAPACLSLQENEFDEEAKSYVEELFSENPGKINMKYPTTHHEAQAWLQDFLENRFQDFGIYEDAIVSEEHFLHHSILTPALNVGLLTPAEVLDKAISFAFKYEIPINSLEGFVRQILGWREFIRAVYLFKGNQERTTNFWKFTRPIPTSFYEGNTGLPPVDQSIKKLCNTAYNHHIERLMVLGNIMVLCEIHPDHVYQWFMEMYIDAYDWVMVPNVYGMSQFADGGIMSTKPYISGSNYLMKMGDYAKGSWQEIWDGLFWRFMDKHRSFFLSNPRLGMLIRTFDNMAPEKKEKHWQNADAFLNEMNR